MNLTNCATYYSRPSHETKRVKIHVTSVNQGLCWSLFGREAEVESLACEVDPDSNPNLNLTLIYS